MKGLFITLEGIDGTGKTTQCNIIKEYFDRKKISCLVLREPGSTVIGEEIRNIVNNNNNNNMSYYTEALLYAAARAQLVNEVIKPSIDSGKVIICDRFLDSSLAYQGVGRGLGIELLENINSYSLKGIEPDITLFLDLYPEVGLLRKSEIDKLDRIEKEKKEFYELVYKGYHKLCKLYPKRIIKIDAEDSLENVSKKIISIIDSYVVNRKEGFFNEVNNGYS